MPVCRSILQLIEILKMVVISRMLLMAFFGIMMHLKLAKTYTEEDIHYPEEYYVLLYGTKLMLNILQTWVNKQRRVVSADS